MSSSYVIPETMRALLSVGKERLEFEERLVPQPAFGEVLVRVGSVGVCGSDKHFYKEGRASSDVMSAPFVMGREFGGTIVAVGEAGRIETDSLVSRRLPFSRATEAWTAPVATEVKTVIRVNDDVAH